MLFNTVKKSPLPPACAEDEVPLRPARGGEGQAFEPDAIRRAWRWAEGQPQLVNALANNIVARRFRGDYSRTVTGDDIDRSAQNLLLENPIHLDYLAERLKEPMVRRAIEPVIDGARFLQANLPSIKIKGASRRASRDCSATWTPADHPVGWLVVFDMNFKKLWSEKQFRDGKTYEA
ncbi:MAG: hypothetical protein LBO66_08510 [Deltaproteobacteria bacterium]|nr:hypothetical protein [Deltaproteobacteria bacterium]